MGELSNCARCNKVFVKTVRNICQDCYREEEEAFDKVYRFLSRRKNREATIDEIVDATNVEKELVIKFIRENRLRTSQFPKLSYPCENCDTPIVSGRLCASCSDEILTDLKRHDEIEAIKKKRAEDDERIHTYYSIDRHKKQ